MEKMIRENTKKWFSRRKIGYVLRRNMDKEINSSKKVSCSFHDTSPGILWLYVTDLIEEKAGIIQEWLKNTEDNYALTLYMYPTPDHIKGTENIGNKIEETNSLFVVLKKDKNNRKKFHISSIFPYFIKAPE